MAHPGETACAARRRTSTIARAAMATCCGFAMLSAGAARAGTWRSDGPSGGLVNAFAVDPSAPTTVYAGTSGGGFFKTVDGGDTWSATGTDSFPFSGLDITGIVVDPARPSRVYASTTDRRDGFVLISDDGGASWTAPRLGSFLSGIVINPQTPSTLYVSGSPDVFKSTDAGATWSPLNLFGGFCIAIDPVAPDTLYVGLINTIAKTIDGGANWTFAKTSFGGASIETLTVDPVTPRTVYAGVHFSGVFKSTDGGENWTAIGPFLDPNPFLPTRIIVDPTNHDTVYAAGLAFGQPGVFKSTDGGAHWAPTPLSEPAFSLAMIDPQTLLAAGFVNGISKTIDAAGTWAFSGTGLANTSPVSLAVDAARPGTVYAGLMGNHVARSSDGGASWTTTASVGLPGMAGKIGALAVDPSGPGTVYAGDLTMTGVARSIDGGDNWSVFFVNSNQPRAMALVIDPSNPATIYSGAFLSGVYKSTNRGVDWIPMNNGLPAAVISMGIDPSAPGTLYAGAFLGGGGIAGVYKTTDGGGQWTPMQNGLPFLDGGVVWGIAVDPFAPTTVYAATSGLGVYKTVDGGGSWSAVNEGLGALEVTALVPDAAVPGTLYAGTRFGVFVTINGGASWSSSNLGLLNQSVTSLASEPGRVYAGTNGNGVFVMEVSTGPAKTVLGRMLSVKNPGPPSARKITVLAQEPNSDAPLDRAAIVANGATLVVSVFGDEGGGEQTFDLPPPWTLIGETGVKYSDRKGLHGPVKSLTLKRSARGVFSMSIQIVGNTGTAPQPHIEIVPPGPGTAARALLTVNGGDAYCVGYGGAAGGAIVNTLTTFAVSKPTVEVCL